MAKNKTTNVKGTEITISQGMYIDYISLTDIAGYKDMERTDSLIENW